jgi:hypothetical protein
VHPHGRGVADVEEELTLQCRYRYEEWVRREKA